MSWFTRNPKKTLAALAVAGVLATDFVFALLFPRPDVGYRIPHAVYHHDLRPDVENMEVWGYRRNRIFTNSLGFKDARRREVELVSSSYRVVFLGDSFTEGRGVPWESTFVGRIGALLEGEVEVLNAAVASYSPKLYHLKAKYLIEEVGLRFDELAVFLDISDPQDEIVYRDFEKANPLLLHLEKHLLDRSILGRTLLQAGGGDAKSDREAPWTDYDGERPYWTQDPDIFERWGREGLRLARKNMRLLYELCRAHGIQLSIAVYPWPQQILAGKRDSLQVTVWQGFAERRDLAFVNYFDVFLGSHLEPAKVVKAYFINGDVHWNGLGHDLVARRWLEDFCRARVSPRCREIFEATRPLSASPAGS